MNLLNRTTVNTKKYPTKIVQFGDGNFLRAFIDWIVHELNNQSDFNSGITIIKARSGQGKLPILNEQEGLFTLFLKGLKNGEVRNEHQIIDCINEGINPYDNFDHYIDQARNPDLEFIVSNTTEAGIIYNENDKLTDKPQSSFPGKVTALLYERFNTFEGATNKGLTFFPCELIDDNGNILREIILKYAELWKLEKSFISWVKDSNDFCNTLVDRIVSGHPKNTIDEIQKELGYRDPLLVEGEQYHLFVIEGPEGVQKKFPADSIGLNVIFTNDIKRYKTIKVRILNGAHTCLVPVGYLYGIDTVRESVENETVLNFLKDAISKEICPTLDFEEAELTKYSNDVLDRFKNPFLKHELMSISLNSVSKYKTRVLPSVLEFIKRKNKLPTHLLISLAALIAFYKGDRNGIIINLQDNSDVLNFFKDLWSSTSDTEVISNKVLSNTYFWGVDLTQFEGLQNEVSNHLNNILSKGMKTYLDEFVN